MIKTTVVLVFFCVSNVLCLGQGNTFPASGHVGIGTTLPTAPLDIRGRIVIDNDGDAAIFTGVSNQELNRYLTLINSVGRTSASGLKAGGILVSDSYAYANPGKNDLIVKGSIGVGTTNPQAKLAVNGNILAKEVKVKTDITVPDYVFAPEYKLPTLAEVEVFVKEHRHLPEIPSAKDIERDGLDLAEMNLLLLKKVEELTLHLIEKDKGNRRLSERLTLVEQRIGWEDGN
ncbi:hypothetical protein ACFOET_11185 [Parapedobacter deserti]|uniref:Uncharacterized protein n=1 Tax=Parapedobacter deserti TaxID=1912957 RepID=A0ABV7JJL1_9SPHI